MTYSLDRNEMPQRPVTLTLGTNTIVTVGKDSNLIDFEETRFRSKALALQETLRPLAVAASKEFGSLPINLESLSKEDESRLKVHTYCAFDFMAIKSSRKSGFLRVQWIPMAIFADGERKLCLHAIYDSSGARLRTLTMVRDGKDERTECNTLSAATKVSMSYLRTYILGKKP